MGPFMEQFGGCSRNVLFLPCSLNSFLLSLLPSCLRFYYFPTLHLGMLFGKDPKTRLAEEHRPSSWAGLAGDRGALFMGKAGRRGCPGQEELVPDLEACSLPKAEGLAVYPTSC